MVKNYISLHFQLNRDFYKRKKISFFYKSSITLQDLAREVFCNTVNFTIFFKRKQ